MTVADRDQVARAALDELLATLDTERVIEVPTARVIPALTSYGWWVRVLRTCEAIAVLYERDLGHEAAPLTRTAMHHVVALRWLAEDPKGAMQAVEYQHRQKQHKLASGALARGWDLGGVEKLPSKPKVPRPRGVEYLDRVEKLCTDFGFSDAYVSFMIESAYVHPSALGADMYIDEVDVGEQRQLGLRTTAKLPPTPFRAVGVIAVHATSVHGAFVEDDDLVAQAARLEALVAPA